MRTLNEKQHARQLIASVLLLISEIKLSIYRFLPLDIKNTEKLPHSRIEISVFTDISVLRFYGYIGNIGEISVDIFSQISIESKLFKINRNI